MKISVISDIHNHTANLRKIMAGLAKKQTRALVCCGDITRPGTLEEMLAFEGKISFCLGNCDRENAAEMLAMAKVHGPLHGFAGQGVMDLDQGGSIAFLHDPHAAALLAESGKFRAVFFGHTHKKEARVLKSGCLLANPGEVEGRGHKPSALVWDSDTGLWEFVEV